MQDWTETRLLMGNEAIAYGAVRAGVQVVTGYPGTPSTEVLETAAHLVRNGTSSADVEWSVNEKAALEVAAGASYAGARVMVTMKQVGMNVASDPLMSLNYIGIKGGMVIVVADDPGPISSQTEQDTRRFGEFAKVLVLDPASPEEAYTLAYEAFSLSERIGRPVILRPTTRVCHSTATVQLLPPDAERTIPGFQRDDGKNPHSRPFVIFPALTRRNKAEIEDCLRQASLDLSDFPGNSLSSNPDAVLGIACSGVSYLYVKEALGFFDNLPPLKLLKCASTPAPLPLMEQFLQNLDTVAVFEELDPVTEDALVRTAQGGRFPANIIGKRGGLVPNVGELSPERIASILSFYLELTPNIPRTPAAPADLPIRPPVLCAGCGHRAAFCAVKKALHDKKAFYCGDIGCYTLGNAAPLEMVDTCLCMGAGITIAQGIRKAEPDAVLVAFIGDSTFFHTGIPGIVNAVYNNADILIVILDNHNTAMTGGQPHPGTGRNALGQEAKALDIACVVRALGVDACLEWDALDFPAVVNAVQVYAEQPGVKVLLLHGPCVTACRSTAKPLYVNSNCTGCRNCIRRIGCPAISLDSAGKAAIDRQLCTGCRLCTNACRFEAIAEEGKV
ncbi:MAG: indolepyruvate ferredoxin oxidoreductase subunit alpha [Oscillospiraceae bacterium]|jgi:indolepyruvate ferredoxin oxidoreductase alpha subunit|nr:indolepyruvate ferredoxin oxidoreductase subunit alpha [Oscillospiraceae bacterium]